MHRPAAHADRTGAKHPAPVAAKPGSDRRSAGKAAGKPGAAKAAPTSSKPGKDGHPAARSSKSRPAKSAPAVPAKPAPKPKASAKPVARTQAPRVAGGSRPTPPKARKIEGVPILPAGVDLPTHGPTDRKSYLSAADLESFREMLLTKRAELIGDVANLEDGAIRSGGSGNLSSSMPIHMADLGSDTWEQELTLGLIENERTLLREIDEALSRIEDKTYGICLATGKNITKARLRAKPWAKYCIEYARKRELGLV